LATVHGVHPGPLNNTIAVAGSNPVPVIVNVNDCCAAAGVGAVVTAESVGPVPAEDTVNTTLLEGAPSTPFCTATR
jgi:hypothetical protein